MQLQNNRKRVLYLTNIISPYRIPFLNYLSKSEGIDLEVLYVAEQEKSRQWKPYTEEIEYSYQILKGLEITTQATTIHLNYGTKQFIEAFHPHVTIIGSDILSSPASWVGLFTSRRIGSKVVRFEGQHAYAVSTSKVRRFFYKQFYKRCDAFFVYSYLTRDYLQSFRIDTGMIVLGYNVGDSDYIKKNIQLYEETIEFKREREKYPAVMFLFSGRLDIGKNIMGLLEAFRRMNFSDAGLVIL
jgi:glycosyltransferase involved in cell wall biosynthesis